MQKIQARCFAARVEHGQRTCDDTGVPLSEEEQRILRQIEQELQADPVFTQRVAKVSRRRVVALSIALVIALVATVLSLAVTFVFAFVGFLVVLVLGFALESEVRLIGRERLGTLPISVWLGGGQNSSRPDR
jgi:hypothetical protein